MSLEFLQLDVFADRPYTGNPLAVFPDAAELTAAQMQAIAREMNLSETTFVTEVAEDSYTMRVFTPAEELPFAGHPTIGTAWALRHLARLSGDEVTQTTEVGPTKVAVEDDRASLERTGTADPASPGELGEDPVAIATALGLEAGDVGLNATVLGGTGPLDPAYSDAGIRTLMVPLRDLGVLERAVPRPDLLAEIAKGAYCFTAIGPGQLRSRGFFPGFGVPEDPGTGMAAAALGIFLADRLGDLEAEVVQGVEMGRPCRMAVTGTADGTVRVGGRCELIFTGRLDRLP
ncbi:MAG TPA: PhzF family phenazine biosynthesis protein [Actinomycetota bacterium]